MSLFVKEWEDESWARTMNSLFGGRDIARAPPIAQRGWLNALVYLGIVVGCWSIYVELNLEGVCTLNIPSMQHTRLWVRWNAVPLLLHKFKQVKMWKSPEIHCAAAVSVTGGNVRLRSDSDDRAEVGRVSIVDGFEASKGGRRIWARKKGVGASQQSPNDNNNSNNNLVLHNSQQLEVHCKRAENWKTGKQTAKPTNQLVIFHWNRFKGYRCLMFCTFAVHCPFRSHFRQQFRWLSGWLGNRYSIEQIDTADSCCHHAALPR